MTVTSGSSPIPEPGGSAPLASAEGLIPRRRLAAGAQVVALVVSLAKSWAARADTKLLCATIWDDSRAFDVLISLEGGPTGTATPSTCHVSALAASTTAAETTRSRRRLREPDGLGVDDMVGVTAGDEVSPCCAGGHFRPGQKADSLVWLGVREVGAVRGIMRHEGAVRDREGQKGAVRGRKGQYLSVSGSNFDTIRPPVHYSAPTCQYRLTRSSKAPTPTQETTGKEKGEAQNAVRMQRERTRDQTRDWSSCWLCRPVTHPHIRQQKNRGVPTRRVRSQQWNHPCRQPYWLSATQQSKRSFAGGVKETWKHAPGELERAME